MKGEIILWLKKFERCRLLLCRHGLDLETILISSNSWNNSSEFQPFLLERCYIMNQGYLENSKNCPYRLWLLHVLVCMQFTLLVLDNTNTLIIIIGSLKTEGRRREIQISYMFQDIIS